MTEVNDHTERMTWCGNMSRHAHHDYEDGNKKMWCCKGIGGREDKSPFDLKPDKQIVLVDPCRALYEFYYYSDGEEVTHMWLSRTEERTADYVLKNSYGSSGIRPCPDDCDYRQLPTPWDPT